MHHRHTSLPEERAPLPRNVLAKETGSAHAGPRPQIGQGGEAPKRVTAEEIASVLPLEVGPCHRTTGNAHHKTGCGERSDISVSHIARRAASACAMVTPSAYSRSPPTGRPRAMRLIVSR